MPANETVTGVLFQPFALGGGTATGVASGAVESILMPVMVSEPVFPARSVQYPVTVKFWPSPGTIVGPLQAPGVTPDKASVATKVAMTGLVYQPLEGVPGV